MREMNDLGLSGISRIKVRPYRPFRVGQDVQVQPHSPLNEYMQNYFPESEGKVKISAVHIFDNYAENDYVVRPCNANEKIEVSHWHLRPVNLIESKLFVPIGLLIPGVFAKLIDTGEIKRVMTQSNGKVFTDDMVKVDEDKIAVLMFERWENPLIESLVRRA